MLFGRVIFFLLVVVLLSGPLLIGAQANAIPGFSLFESSADRSDSFDLKEMVQVAGILEAKLLLPNDRRVFKSMRRGQAIAKAVDQVLLPDFEAIDDAQARREAFFAFLTPLVQEENRRLQEERRRILDLQTWRIADEPFRHQDRAWLEEMAQRYQIAVKLEEDSEEFFVRLLEVVDIIPVSLALAQAANESGLGRSSLAKNKNNLFGQTCHTRQCGAPSDRSKHKSHRTRMANFASIRDSVRYYVTNLNVNPFYQNLRALRADLRARGEKVTGDILGQGLVHYSELGSAYVHEIIALIDRNDLTRFDEAEFLP